MDLKKNIKAYGWTVSAIAEKLGITQSSLSVQLSNNTMPLSRLQEIADIIRVSLSELVTDEVIGAEATQSSNPDTAMILKAIEKINAQTENAGFADVLKDSAEQVQTVGRKLDTLINVIIPAFTDVKAQNDKILKEIMEMYEHGDTH